MKKINFLKSWLMLVMLLVGVGTMRAETIFNETFGTPTANTNVTAYSGWSETGVTYSGSAKVGVTSSNVCSLNTSSKSGYMYVSSAQIKEFIVSGINTSGYTNVKLSINYKGSGTSAKYALAYSTDGTSYTSIVSSQSCTTGWKTLSDKDLPSASNLCIKITLTTINYQVYFDDLIITGTSTGPSKTLSSIAVKTAPSTITYTEGQKFNPAGLVITADYGTDGKEDVAYSGNESKFSFSPTTSTPLTTSNSNVTITFGGKSTTQSITVNPVPSHDAKFFVNGQQYGETQSVKEGSAITFPASNPSDIDDKKFMGWAEAPISGTTNTAPTFFTSGTMGNADKNYYAVFATIEGDASPKTKSFGYSSHEGWTLSQNVVDKSTYYLLQKNDYIESPSFADLSQISKIVVKVGKFSNKGAFKVTTYNKTFNESVPSSTDGVTYTYDNLDFTGYGTVRVTNTDGATSGSTSSSQSGSRFFSMTITYTEVSYSNYCTTVAAPKPTPELSFSPAEYEITKGDDFTAPTLTNPKGVTVTYAASNVTPAGCIEVAENGAVTVNAVGSATITASFAGNDDFKPNSASYTLNVLAPKHTVTATLPEGGSYTVKVGDGEEVRVDAEHSSFSVSEGAAVTLTSTADGSHKVHSTPFVLAVEEGEVPSLSAAGAANKKSFVMPAKAITITAQYTQTYNITAGSCANGSIAKIADKDGNEITRTSQGSKVVVTTEADEYYHLIGMYYVKANEETRNDITVTDGVGSFSMVGSNITVYAEFEEDTKYTITWSINGDDSRTDEFYENTSVVFPSDVADIDSKKFVGWIDAETYEHATDAPTYVTEATATADKTYYAVFAVVEGSVAVYTKATSLNVGDQVIFALGEENGKPKQGVTGANNGATISTNENEWIVYTATTYEGKNGIVLQKGNGDYQRSANGNFDFTSNSPSTFTTNASSHIIGYSFTLYNTPQGNKFYGTKGTDYVEFLMWKVEGGMSYSDFTTAPAPVHKTVRENLTAGNYGTICFPYAVAEDNFTGAVFFSITGKIENEGTFAGIEMEEVNALEAGVPYIYRATAATINFTYLPVNAATEGKKANGLIGSLVAGDNTLTDNGTSYILSSSDNQLHKWVGVDVTTGIVGKAYIDVAQIENATPAPGRVVVRVVGMEDQATDLETIENEKVEKFFENGQIYILKAGHMYDVTGRLVK